MAQPKLALGISGSPSPTSSSRRLVKRVLALLAAQGFITDVIDLSELPAEALLARGEDAAVSGALAKVGEARIIVVGTPVYRATYTALLKTLFDLMPQDHLLGKVAVLIATGGAPEHMLSVDHGLRPLIANLGGVSASTAIYATPADFVDGEPAEALAARLASAADEASNLARD
jgi:FMN reductase